MPVYKEKLFYLEKKGLPVFGINQPGQPDWDKFARGESHYWQQPREQPNQKRKR